jgi:hypothetical protein
MLSERFGEIQNYFDATVGQNSLSLLIRNVCLTLQRPETFDESSERRLRMKFRVAQEFRLRALSVEELI